jgi:hypothetical protein
VRVFCRSVQSQLPTRPIAPLRLYLGATHPRGWSQVGSPISTGDGLRPVPCSEVRMIRAKIRLLWLPSPSAPVAPFTASPTMLSLSTTLLRSSAASLLLLAGLLPAALVRAEQATEAAVDPQRSAPYPAMSISQAGSEPGAEALPAAAPASEADSEASEDPWRGTVELYGFAPLRTTGTTTIRGFDADTDLDLGDLLSSLKWATSLRGSVERQRWGLLTDLSYVRLGADSARTTPGGRFTGKASVGATQGLYDLAVRYRFGDPEAAVAQPGDFSIIPYAGVRVIDARLDVEAQIRGNGPLGLVFERQGDFGRTWAQPLLGVQASVFMTPKLRLFARGDIGGFGLSGEKDLSGNAQVGLGYAVGNNTDLNLSWRFLGLRYENDRTPASGFSSYQNGIELGLKFFF